MRFRKIAACITALALVCGTGASDFLMTGFNNTGTVSADEYFVTNNPTIQLKYKAESDHIVITGARLSIPHPGYDLEIPDEIDGLPVTEIADGALYNAAKPLTISTLILPDTLKKIGNDAFREQSVEKITFPDSLEEIGDRAFLSNPISQICIPANVSKIGRGAFGDNINTRIEVDKDNKYYTSDNFTLYSKDKTVLLRASRGQSGEFVIPDTVKKIDDYAFSYTEYSSFVLPEGIEEVGQGAFSINNKIKSINIPSTLKVIDSNVFFGKVSSIEVSEDNPFFEIVDGILYDIPDNRLIKMISDTETECITVRPGTVSIESNAFYECEDLKKAELPDGIKTIGSDAFNSSGLEEINFPDSLEYIGDYAFAITQLKKAELGNSVTYLGDSAFFYCTSLSDVKLPESINNICEYTFSGCISLEEITIPECVETVDDYAFSGCDSLSRINMYSGTKFLNLPENASVNYLDSRDSIEKNGIIFSSDMKTLISANNKEFSGSYVIPDGVEEIAANAFAGKWFLTDITIPESVKKISKNAFYETGLTDLTIPSSVEEIGDSAFMNSDELRSVRFEGDNVSLGKNIFSNCYSLSDISLPDNLTAIPEGTFKNCFNIEYFALPGNVSVLDCSVIPPGVHEMYIPEKTKISDLKSLKELNMLNTVFGYEGSDAQKAAEESGCSFILNELNLRGDVNSDGKLNIIDMIYLKNCLLTGTEVSETDLNCNYITDSEDLLILKDLLLNNRANKAAGINDIKIMNFEFSNVICYPAETFGIFSESELEEFINDAVIDPDEAKIFTEKLRELVKDNNIYMYSADRKNSDVLTFNFNRSSVISPVLKASLTRSIYNYDNENIKYDVFVAAIPKDLCGHKKLKVEEHEDYNLPLKPVIYLYPEEETEINVKLSMDRKSVISYSYPKYPDETGWTVTAEPDSTLYDKNGREYSYLFWEAKSSRKWDMSEGFVVKGEDTVEFLQEKLEYLGLTPKEYNDFIVFWLPKMQDNKYNLITFQTDDYEEMAKLEITPEPDCIQRVFMTYKPLEEYQEIKEQKLQPFERHGYSVIEWGGAEIR